MELIDKLYFTGLINVPNSSTEYSTISNEVAKYSKEFMLMVFGYQLYKQLIVANPTDNTTNLGKLYYGTEYTYQDITYKWNGLVNADRISPMSDYAYYGHTMLAWSNSGNTANTVPVPELAIVNGGGDKLVRVHNRMERGREQDGYIGGIQALYDYMYRSGLYDDFVPPYDFRNLNSLGI